MLSRAKIFVDYWNFQLNWNERAGDARCDWLELPGVLIRAARRLPGLEDLRFTGIHVYASVDPHNENLQNWLETFLAPQPGFRVSVSRIVRRHRGVRCHRCGAEVASCPECGEPFTVGTSKGLISALVADLVAFTLEGTCDVPVVVSSDTELVPAVVRLGRRGVPVVHAGWRDVGHDLGRAAWASLDLDQMIPDLVREPAP